MKQVIKTVRANRKELSDGTVVQPWARDDFIAVLDCGLNAPVELMSEAGGPHLVNLQNNQVFRVSRTSAPAVP